MILLLLVQCTRTVVLCFENKNGELMKLIQGTQHVDKQLISAVSMIQKKAKLLSHCHDSMTPDGKALIGKMK